MPFTFYHVLLLKHHLVVREIGKAKAVGESSSTQLPSPEPAVPSAQEGRSGYNEAFQNYISGCPKHFKTIFYTDFI